MTHLKNILTIALLLKSISSFAQASDASNDNRFIKHTITNDFISEGVAVTDVNNDGKLDIIAGAFWFEAPDWKRHGRDWADISVCKKTDSRQLYILGLEHTIQRLDRSFI